MTLHKTIVSCENDFHMCTPHLGALGQAGDPVPGRHLKGLVSRFDPLVSGELDSRLDTRGEESKQNHKFIPGNTKETDELFSITSQLNKNT